ncbi:MAG: hypothetical protein GF417_10580 [Candidatus Latescibacteria bacterium]|nr:hypothetical protein [bacterium]MBD3424872.1 hypothetical protein [Candidatus Latescibacterota bacterium]
MQRFRALSLIIFLLYLFSGCTQDPCFEEPGWESWDRIELPFIVNYGDHYICAAECPDGTLIVGSWGNVFKQTEEGSWRTCFINQRNRPVNCLVSSSKGLIFASQDPGGVFLSEDNGITWKQVNSSLPCIYVNDLALAPDGSLFAATERGIFATTDNGLSWENRQGEEMSDAVLSLAADSQGVIYAGTERKIFSSENCGKSWIEMESETGDINAYDLAAAPDGCIFAASSRGIIGRLSPGEDRWVNVGPSDGENPMVSVEVSEEGDVFISEHRRGVLVSRDGGNSWRRIELGMYNAQVFDLCAVRGRVIACSRSVLNLERGGHAWEIMNLNLPKEKPYGWDYVKISEDGLIAAGNNQYGVVCSIDQGRSWIKVWGYKYTSDLACRNGKVYCVAGSRFGIADLYEGWIEVSEVIASENYNLAAVEVDHLGRIYTGNCAEGIFRSGDDGASWEKLNFIPEDGFIQSDELDIFTKSDGTIFLSVDNEYIYRSDDQGASWNRLDIYGLSLTIAPNGELYTCWQGGIYRSGDNGDNWRLIKDRREISSIRWSKAVKMAIGENGHTVLANYKALLHSLDGGVTWYLDHSLEYYSGGHSIRDLCFGPSGRVYLVGHDAILRSSESVYH